MTWCRVGSRAATAARTATVFPAPTSPVTTPSVCNPAEFHQMHDLMRRDLRTCAGAVLQLWLCMWRRPADLHPFCHLVQDSAVVR